MGCLACVALKVPISSSPVWSAMRVLDWACGWPLVSCSCHDMTTRERGLYHQLHPSKLLVDWLTAILAGALLWQQQLLAALVVGFGPSIVVTLTFLSGTFDHALGRIKSRSEARSVALQLSPDVNAVRFAGLAVSWVGCWVHRTWLLPAGVLLILAGWSIAWERGRSTRGLS